MGRGSGGEGLLKLPLSVAPAFETDECSLPPSIKAPGPDPLRFVPQPKSPFHCPTRQYSKKSTIIKKHM
jgi:hypothetical protein